MTTEARHDDRLRLLLPAGGVVLPYQPGQGMWQATSNGYRMRVRLDPPAPRGGQVVRLLIDVDGPGPGCCEVALDFGGQSDYVGRDKTTGACPSVPGNAFEIHHVYNQSGLVPFTVTAGPCERINAAWLSGWVQVAEGKSSVQGPAAPKVELGTHGGATHRGEFGYGAVAVSAQDRDGWISEIVIDWGDGTPAGTYHNGWPCMAVGPYGWPYENMMNLPGHVPAEPGGYPLGSAPPPVVPGPTPEHYYAAAGSYTVTVTARSTACDGSQPQEAMATLGWQIQSLASGSSDSAGS